MGFLSLMINKLYVGLGFGEGIKLKLIVLGIRKMGLLMLKFFRICFLMEFLVI